MGRRRKAKHPEPLHGLLLVDKPCGPSSFGVISQLRRALGASRVGHTGTLDPAASGLLVVCFGQATRLSAYLTAERKRYEAEVTFGVSTDTLDREGLEIAADPPALSGALTEEQLLAALPGLRGAQEQRPPAFSAIQQGGERAYAKARRGEEVTLPPRSIEIYALELQRFSPGPRPRATLEVYCSKGTYIRSLARDLGAALGLNAHLSALRRTEVGAFSLQEALTLEGLELGRARAALIPLAESLASWPLRRVTERERRALETGQKIERRETETTVERARALDESGALVALLESAGTQWKVLRGFPALPEQPPTD